MALGSTNNIKLWRVMAIAVVCWVVVSGLGRNLAADNEEAYKGLKLFSEVIDIIQKNYVEETSERDLIEKAIQGMVQRLDPHSAFLPPEALEELQVDTKRSPSSRPEASEASFSMRVAKRSRTSSRTNRFGAARVSVSDSVAPSGESGRIQVLNCCAGSSCSSRRRQASHRFCIAFSASFWRGLGRALRQAGHTCRRS